MGGVGGVLHDAVGFAGASCKENVQDGWERGTDDLCSRVHCPLEGLTVSSTAVPVQDSDAAGQHTLNGAPVSPPFSCALKWYVHVVLKSAIVNYMIEKVKNSPRRKIF